MLVLSPLKGNTMAVNYDPSWKDGRPPGKTDSWKDGYPPGKTDYERGLDRAREEFKNKYPYGFKPSPVRPHVRGFTWGEMAFIVAGLTSFIIGLLWGLHVFIR